MGEKGREETRGWFTSGLLVRWAGLKHVSIRGLGASEVVTGQERLREGDGTFGLGFEREANSPGLRIHTEK